jgi:hypothetical protein
VKNSSQTEFYKFDEIKESGYDGMEVERGLLIEAPQAEPVDVSRYMMGRRIHILQL